MTESADLIWCVRSVPGIHKGHLMVKNLHEVLEESFLGKRFDKSPLLGDTIKLISEEEDWLNFPEDSREMAMQEIEERALRRVPQSLYLSERLFSKPVTQSLLELGAENLQIFPVELTHPFTKRSWSGYGLVNVMGLVDLSKNRNFVVALEEKTMDLVFSDRAKQKLEALGLGIEFMKRYPNFPR